ncbi:NAD(P)/FAD-dependent oxidoreductase [Humidisolicoccus flavus]|uniref:NAD(P)/FAD-dependent oxidoreductase n=1 Tax=Humidisolicoccus flavus TaxID=3111414 RepID=UPI0032499AA9
MKKILIAGGGYAGLYAARGLERTLRSSEAQVTLVDPLPYMAYLPFLPEVAAGSIEPRHAVVSQRRHLKTTEVITAKITSIDHANRVATITAESGDSWQHEYDELIFTAGSVTRTFPIPGVADTAIGMKTIEEAVQVRDRLITNFARAASMPAGPARDRLLTVTVVGGGFAGIETFAELRSLASSLLPLYPQLTIADTHFHLIEAMGRIMPEVSLKTSEWVIKSLDEREAKVHLDTQLKSAVGGVIELSTGETFESDLIVWTAGVMAHPVAKTTDLPLDERGRVTALPTLQVARDGVILEGAWTAGDVSAVPDISKTPGPGGFCVPNAQHAVRQGRLLAKNVAAVVRGEAPREYNHSNMGAVAGLGVGNGVFQSGKMAIKGPLAWMAHRGYHGLAIPMWERKLRVFGGWWNNFWLGRDDVALPALTAPRAAFEAYASRPKPPVDEAPAVPAAPAVEAPAAPAAEVSPKLPAADAEPATEAAEPKAKKGPAKKPAAKKAPAKKADNAAIPAPEVTESNEATSSDKADAKA